MVYISGIKSTKPILPIKGTRNSYWINSMTCVAPLMSSTSCPLERLSKRRRCDTSHAMVGLAEKGVESTRVKEKTTIKTPQQTLKIITMFIMFIIIDLVCLLRGRGAWRIFLWSFFVIMMFIIKCLLIVSWGSYTCLSLIILIGYRSMLIAIVMLTVYFVQ